MPQHRRRTTSTTRRTSLIALAGLTLGTVAALSQSSPAGAATAVVDRTMSDTRIVESSSLVRSGYSTSVLWTSNDSGGGPVLYAIAANGATVGTYTVTGASAKDWEAMAAARSGTIAPAANEAAEASAAWAGRAAIALVRPSSSRACAPIASWAVNWTATSDANLGSSPRLT
jgi:hypothetical protein